MKRTLMLGLAIMLIGAIGLFLAGLLDIALSNSIMGVGAGVTIAVVRQSHPLLRLLGFLIGVALGTGFLYMVMGGIPGGESTGGRTVALVIVMLASTLVAGLSANRIPQWTMLIGAVAMLSQFGSTYAGAPWTLEDVFPSILPTVLIMGGIGFLVSPVAEWLAARERREAAEERTSTESPPPVTSGSGAGSTKGGAA